MARKRTIPKKPKGRRNYFVVDANVLVYVALAGKNKSRAISFCGDSKEEERAKRCTEWWRIIKQQIEDGDARVYVPDIGIAEAFKVLAKWYYRKGYFRNAASYNQARRKLRQFVAATHREMSLAGRKVRVHDMPTNRDIIIAVDRFFATLYKSIQGDVSIADLILLSTAKYLMDFYDIPGESLYVLTCDRSLVHLASRIQELPRPINPTEPRYDASKTFADTDGNG